MCYEIGTEKKVRVILSRDDPGADLSQCHESRGKSAEITWLLECRAPFARV